jgi:hypothetical protein
MNREPINMEAKMIKGMGKTKENKRRSSQRIITQMLKLIKVKFLPKKLVVGKAK